MFKGKKGFLAGFVCATVMGATIVYSYTTSPDGDWIRDAGNYPTVTDQINVLGDIAPGAVLMQEVGLRLNAINAAAKKQNWGFAEYEADEMGEALERMAITRPEFASALDAFVTSSVADLQSAIATHDKGTALAAVGTTANACTACHISTGNDFLTVKIGKSALPIQSATALSSIPDRKQRLRVGRLSSLLAVRFSPAAASDTRNVAASCDSSGLLFKQPS